MARTSVEQNERKRERTTRWRISWGKRDKLTRSGAPCSRGVTSRRCEKGPQKWDRCNKRKSSKCAELWRYSFARMKDKRQAENYLICQANEQFSQRGCLTYRHSSPVFQTNNLNAILTFVTVIKLPSAKLVTYKNNDKSFFQIELKRNLGSSILSDRVLWARSLYMHNMSWLWSRPTPSTCIYARSRWRRLSTAAGRVWCALRVWPASYIHTHEGQTKKGYRVWGRQNRDAYDICWTSLTVL